MIDNCHKVFMANLIIHQCFRENSREFSKYLLSHHLELLRLYYDQIIRFFLCIPASAADADAVNPNGMKMLIANG